MNEKITDKTLVGRSKVGFHRFNEYFPLIALAAGFILWRLCFLFFTHPQYLEASYEELYRGAAVREFLNGSFSSLWAYRPDHYSGGYYVIVIVLAGFLKLFGFSMLAFKSVSILWGLLTLITWVFLLKEYVNPKAAWIFGILYLFSPQPVTGLSSVVLGDHAETLLLSSLSVLLFFRLRDPTRSHKLYTLITLCLLAGFSVWFAYIYAITLAALLVFTLADRPRIEWKYLFTGIFSFLAGFSLWGLFYWKNHFQSFMVQGAPLWQSFSLSALVAPLFSWKKFFVARFFFEMRHRPLAGSFYGWILGVYIIFLLAAVIVNLTAAREKRRAPTSPDFLFLVFVMLNFLACQLYDDVGLRYLLPCYPFLMAWIASRFSRINSGKNFVIGVMLLGLTGSGIFSTLYRFSIDHKGEFLSHVPYASLAPVYGGPVSLRENP